MFVTHERVGIILGLKFHDVQSPCDVTKAEEALQEIVDKQYHKVFDNHGDNTTIDTTNQIYIGVYIWTSTRTCPPVLLC